MEKHKRRGRGRQTILRRKDTKETRLSDGSPECSLKNPCVKMNLPSPLAGMSSRLRTLTLLVWIIFEIRIADFVVVVLTHEKAGHLL